jgi:nucleotide-binding universal stress UspA family protein
VAILATGAVFLITAVALPIEALGSAASVMFLLVFAMVNLALVALRRKRPTLKRPFRIPLYPVLPLAGFAINTALAIYQVTFDPRPWLVVIGWTLFGLLLYFAVFERRVRARGPQVLALERAPAAEKSRFRIVVPLANPDTVKPLIDVAAALARPRGGEIVAVTVALVPAQLPIHEGLKLAHHRRPLLRTAQKRAEELGVDLRGDLRIAHRLEDAMLTAVQTHAADLLVMGWKGFANTRERIFGELTDHMIRHCPCDLALVKVVHGPTDRILLATSGGPNATLGAEFTRGFCEMYDASVDACVVVPAQADVETEQAALDRIGGSLEALELGGEVGRKLIKSNSVAAGIAKASRDYDLVVIGAAPSQLFKQILVGDIPEKVARYSPQSVILIRRWQGKMSGLFRKLFG